MKAKAVTLYTVGTIGEAILTYQATALSRLVSVTSHSGHVLKRLCIGTLIVSSDASWHSPPFLAAGSELSILTSVPEIQNQARFFVELEEATFEGLL